MKVVLFKINWWNPKAAGIGLVTASEYCHAAVILDGDTRLLDASESRGNVDYNKQLIEFAHREVLVYDIPYDCANAIIHAQNKIGSKYGWKGIWGWVAQALTLGLLRLSNARNMYCFEFVLYVLSYIKEVRSQSTPIFDKLFLQKIDSDDLLAALERSSCPVVFEGIAKDFKLL